MTFGIHIVKQDILTNTFEWKLTEDHCLPDFNTFLPDILVDTTESLLKENIYENMRIQIYVRIINSMIFWVYLYWGCDLSGFLSV